MNDMLKNKIYELLVKMKKDKKAVFIIVLGVVGMLLISLSEFTPSENSDKSYETEQIISETDITKELENIIGEISGVGRVKVMITYECSKESVYAKDISEQENEKNTKKDSKYILVETGSDESGLILKEIYPKVCGVAVVCDGGNDPILKSEITSVLKALFDISSNNISIVQMQS